MGCPSGRKGILRLEGEYDIGESVHDYVQASFLFFRLQALLIKATSLVMGLEVSVRSTK